MFGDIIYIYIYRIIVQQKTYNKYLKSVNFEALTKLKFPYK